MTLLFACGGLEAQYRHLVVECGHFCWETIGLQSFFITNKNKNRNPFVFDSKLIVKHFMVTRKASGIVRKHVEVICKSKIKDSLTLDHSVIKGQQSLSSQYYNYVSLCCNCPL